MNEVFNLNALPNRRLSIRKIIALHPHMKFDDAITVAKRDMATQLAYKILEGDVFFHQHGSQVAGTSMLEYSVNCIVLTENEFAELKRQSFKEGLEHARGFMSTYVN